MFGPVDPMTRRCGCGMRLRGVPSRGDNQLGEKVAVGCHCRGFRYCSTFDMWLRRGSTRKDGVEARCSVRALPSRQPRCVECGIVLLLSSSGMLRASVGEVPTLARGEKQATRDEFRTWLRIQGQSQSEEGIFFSSSVTHRYLTSFADPLSHSRSNNPCTSSLPLGWGSGDIGYGDDREEEE